MRIKTLSSALLLLAAGSAVAAQLQDTCQAEPALQNLYTQSKTSPDRIAVLQKAIQENPENPENPFLVRWLLLTPSIAPGSRAAEFRATLDAHPGEPLYLYMYGYALLGSDTAKAIQLLTEASAKDPSLAYVYQALVEAYATPKFRDRPKLTKNLIAYLDRCPADLNGYVYVRDVLDSEVLPNLTKQFRAAIEQRQTVGTAAYYRSLWPAEFRATNPAEYGRLREQVRADMKRIRELDPDNTDHNRALIDGYRLLGDNTTADALQGVTDPTNNFFSAFQA